MTATQRFSGALAHSLSGETLPAVVHIHTPPPPMGCKAWLLNDKGIFVLERGPGTMVTAAVTHAGAGSLEIIDGVPDDRGFFSDDRITADEIALMADRVARQEAGEDVGEVDTDLLERYGKRNGRPFYLGSPVVMGSWMLNAGFHNGLTIRAGGGNPSASAIATIVWTAFKAR